jgi:hypothetical protein
MPELVIRVLVEAHLAREPLRVERPAFGIGALAAEPAELGTFSSSCCRARWK